MPQLKKPGLEQESVTDSPMFTRGYSSVRARLQKRSSFTMSCYNCEYFYQAVGDKEEVCQNPDVLKYDMVVTESSIYCNRWELTHREQSVKGMFKKGKRNANSSGK